ncbi:hypothetical protein DM01DRAFT_1331118 [Hesseltinella vesiculosa]|uniref:RING-type domain-containing protein n=1 Tax=Hesseltinella vesiculosa TaxID=101127 RepID=A0A1X2GZC8_9FUNG|nr:hypothetical protein DM01DRAFT_1331118 [Hesseltinella vesiculosa]
MHLKRDLLLDELNPELLCGICHDLLDNPMQVHCAEDHMFCYNCILNYGKSSCPSCMESLNNSNFQLSKFAKRQISRLRIKCPSHALGCTWEGALEDDHIQQCSYQMTPCPNSNHGCTEKISNATANDHRAQCLFELMSCPNQVATCKPFLRKDDQAHDAQCAGFRCKYHHEGCAFVGTLSQVGQHGTLYCDRLHDRIHQLEREVQQLKTQLLMMPPTNDLLTPFPNPAPGVPLPGNDKTSYSMPSPSSSSVNDKSMPVTSSAMAATPTSSSQTPIQNPMSPMDDITLLHQMFSSDFFATNASQPTPSADMVLADADLFQGADLNLTSPFLTTSPIHLMPSNSDPHTPPPASHLRQRKASTSSNTSKAKEKKGNKAADGAKSASSSTTADPSAPAPKRTTNGRLIRYSKNKQLAHGAMRMARQRTSSNTITTEVILNALQAASAKGNHDSPGPDPVSAHSPHHPHANSPTPTPASFSFKSLDDVTKFLEELPPIQEASPYLSPHARKSPAMSPYKTMAYKQKSDKRPKHLPPDSPSSSQPQPMDISSPAPADATPMFVLASSFLSKRNQDH